MEATCFSSHRVVSLYALCMLYTINQHGVGFPDCRTTLTCLLTPSLRYRQTAPLPPPVPVIASRGSFSVTQTRPHDLTSICQEYKGDRLDIADLSYCGKTAWRGDIYILKF